MIVAIGLLFAGAYASAQTNMVQAGQQTELGIDSIPGASYTWDLYINNTSINFAIVPGNCPVADAHFVGGNTSPTVVVEWITPGTYYFRVIVYDSSGCQNLKVGMMQVINCPAPAVTFVPCFDIVTSTEARPFRLKGGMPLNGSYSGGAWVNNPAAGLFNPQAAPAGLIPVTYTFTAANGCSDSARAFVRVVPAPAAFHCGDPWLDIRDSLTYPTVAVATPGTGQCWLAANLNRGVQIPSTVAQTDNCLNEKYCYNNIAGDCNAFGALYQWDELMKYESTPGSQGICPPGWHVPTAGDWMTLLDFFGGNSLAGTALKDPAAGFHVLPGGVLYLNQTWSFKGLATLFWTSTPTGSERVVSRGLNTVDQSVSYYESLRNNAFPVRCIHD
ncbi:MAG TPA: FISUMP domain-containing protein [Bacteroidales bacterium]|nr:FISUMP domain-containing protein [Bacteroidales bacterium]HPS62551.1 FISUMP domain-containing protein [Bacteroidales bacterium]